MEERKDTHCLQWVERKAGTISGVRDVISFDDRTVILATECGRITIKGEQLHVNQLNLEKGETEISGRMDSLVYTGNGTNDAKTGKSLLGRLFQ